MAKKSQSKKPPFATEAVRQTVRANARRNKIENGEKVDALTNPKATQNVMLREEAFVAVYLNNGFNGRRAVLDCGLFPDVSEKAADVVASRMLNRARVVEKIAEFKRRWAERYSITPERIIGELAACAFGNVDDYIKVQDDGSVVCDFTNIKDPILGRRIASAVSSVETETYVEGYEGEDRDTPINVKRTKFRLHDKIAALKLLAQIFQMPGVVPQAQQTNNFIVKNMLVQYQAMEQKLLSDCSDDGGEETK